MKIEKLTTHIGAELSGVNLAEAVTNDDLFGEIRQALLAHRVLFLRDQQVSKTEHIAFAQRFGPLEDHPVAGSDPIIRASSASTRTWIRRRTIMKMPGIAMQPGARSRPLARFSAAWNAPRLAATPSG